VNEILAHQAADVDTPPAEKASYISYFLCHQSNRSITCLGW